MANSLKRSISHILNQLDDSQDTTTKFSKTKHNAVRVAVIGNADSSHFTKDVMEKIKNQCEEIIKNEWKLNESDVLLVSGGSSQVDHVVVQMWLEHSDKYKGLELYLPCAWDVEKKQFYDNGRYQYRENPGKLLNMLHKKCSLVLKQNTLEQIDQASRLGAVLNQSGFGFHARNSLVAKSDYIIAFTWQDNPSKKEEPVSGGTRDSWNKANGVKKHVNLFDILA